jgi:hypothetical protein
MHKKVRIFGPHPIPKMAALYPISQNSQSPSPPLYTYFMDGPKKDDKPNVASSSVILQDKEQFYSDMKEVPQQFGRHLVPQCRSLKT